MDTTVHAELLATKAGLYTVYVFRNLDDNEYIMCTQLPNWKYINMKIGDTGFLTVENAVRGEKYINSDMQEEVYKYSNIYFKDFIKENKNLDITI